ncbi:hypothetical protein [Caballeronia sordidicola]|uniref:Uncharacterized protein n=1 Tax=Caballeronia sordidicola TaxID=196367 RepID=A0A242N457_CABSO|nr:hypothetical protein [Caballeronia sordidicola]OTP78458.1 hypothetical protein PAMC26577_04665 [Caballeronia sordidicola]
MSEMSYDKRARLRSIADVRDLLHFKRVARTGVAFHFQPIAPIVTGGGVRLQVSVAAP